MTAKQSAIGATCVRTATRTNVTRNSTIEPTTTLVGLIEA